MINLRILLSVQLLFALAMVQFTVAQITIDSISLRNNDLIYNPAVDRIFASVPSDAGAALGNRLAIIDPSTGDMSSTGFIGSEPTPLAVSDDGSFVYVGLRGSASVSRYDVQSNTVGLEIGLGTSGFLGNFFAEDIAVLPGSPNSIAVSRRNVGFSPRHEGVVVFDGAVQRASQTSGHTGANRIEFGDDASTLFGLNNETTEFGFRTMTVDADGATVDSVVRGAGGGFGTDIEFAGGRIYMTNGTVLDAATGARLGRYSASGSVAVDVAAEQVYFLGSTSVRIFDLTTFVPIGEIAFGFSTSGSSLTRVGENGLAFRDSSNVYLIDSPEFIGTPPVEAEIILGDVNEDGTVDFSDIPSFIVVLAVGGYQAEADCDPNGVVDFSDISAFIEILRGN